jgi:hypothetical protein
VKYRLFSSRLILAALGVATLFGITGCLHYGVDFTLMDNSFKPKGRSIAIISGTKQPQSVAIAAMVSDSLRKISHYQVASAAQISRALAVYPVTIKGPYRSAYLGSIDTDWTLGDRQKIADIQRSLGVDYLYVIWAPTGLQSGRSDSSVIPAVAQLFEQPNSTEVAETSITVMADEKETYLQDGVNEIARKLAEQTHMVIAAKK